MERAFQGQASWEGTVQAVRPAWELVEDSGSSRPSPCWLGRAAFRRAVPLVTLTILRADPPCHPLSAFEAAALDRRHLWLHLGCFLC